MGWRARAGRLETQPADAEAAGATGRGELQQRLGITEPGLAESRSRVQLRFGQIFGGT